MFNEAELFNASLFINGVHVAERSDVDTNKIIGVEEDTITCVAYDDNNNYDFYYYSSEGDGTVPTYSALNNADKYSYKTYAFFKNHTDLIKYEGCIQLIIDIINEEPYVYYDPQTVTATMSSTNLPNGLLTEYSEAESDERITIVAKNIESMELYNNSFGSAVYNVGEELFCDIDGEQIRVGSIWSLGENSNQYVLFNDSYTVANIESSTVDSSIRIDYCNYGLSDNAVMYNGISINDIIKIDKLTENQNTVDGVSISWLGDK